MKVKLEKHRKTKGETISPGMEEGDPHVKTG